MPLLRTTGYADNKYRMLDGFAGAALLRADLTREAISELATAAAADPRVGAHARGVDAYGDDVAATFGRDTGARDRAPDRRALADWTVRTARRQVTSFESAAVRFVHR